MFNRNESLKPSLEHKVHWFDNNKGVYTFTVPIEVLVSQAPINFSSAGNTQIKEIFDEFAHHPLAYVLANHGSRTCIDEVYYPTYIHSLIISRFLVQLLNSDGKKTVKEIFSEVVTSCVRNNYPDLSTLLNEDIELEIQNGTRL